jgi:hypothetical protein
VAGLLDGALSRQVYAGFKGKLQKGTLRRAAPAMSAGLDDRGDPIATDVLTWGFEGFKEAYNEAFRVAAEIPETDVKVNIFSASLPRGVQPTKDDTAELPRGSGQWWQLRKVATDPATALFVCQAYSVQAPQ